MFIKTILFSDNPIVILNSFTCMILMVIALLNKDFNLLLLLLTRLLQSLFVAEIYGVE